MKKFTIFTAVCLLSAILFSACAPYGDAGESTTDQSSLGVYAGLVDLLRAELEQLKKNQSEDASEYEAKIKELEEKLAALSASTKAPQVTDKPSDTNAPQNDKLPFTYTEKDGKITVTKLTDETVRVLVIPDKIDGKPVTAIADSAFSGSDITGVSLPSTLTEIGWFSFSGCVYLMNVSIPVGVSSIGYDAFGNCPKLTVYCPSGSYAEKYAKSYGLTVVATS